MERSEIGPSFDPAPSPEVQLGSPEVQAGSGEVLQSPEKQELVENTQTEVAEKPLIVSKLTSQEAAPMDNLTPQSIDWENASNKVTAVKDVKNIETWMRQTAKYAEAQTGITELKRKSGVIPAKGGGK